MNEVLQFKTFDNLIELVGWVTKSPFYIQIAGITPIHRSEGGLTLFYYAEAFPKPKEPTGSTAWPEQYQNLFEERYKEFEEKLKSKGLSNNLFIQEYLGQPDVTRIPAVPPELHHLLEDDMPIEKISELEDKIKKWAEDITEDMGNS